MFFNIFTVLYNHHYYLIPEHFHYLNIETLNPLAVTLHYPSPPRCWQPLIYLLSQWIRLFWTFHINGIIEYVVFCV